MKNLHRFGRIALLLHALLVLALACPTHAGVVYGTPFSTNIGGLGGSNGGTLFPNVSADCKNKDSVLPVASWSDNSTISSGQTIYLQDNKANDTYTIAGASRYSQYGNVFPVNHTIQAADSPVPHTIRHSFYYSGPAFEINTFNSLLSEWAVYIDCQYFDNISNQVGVSATGSGFATAQGSSAANKVTLAAGESATSGIFNQFYFTIVGGTGTFGETRLATAYDGTTKELTVSQNFTVQPNNTTQYVMTGSQRGLHPFGAPNNGSLDFVKFDFSAASGYSGITPHRIDIYSAVPYAIIIGPNDSIKPAGDPYEMPCVMFGDSIIAGTASPQRWALYGTQLANSIGCSEINAGIGGTGWGNRGAGSSLLNFTQRLAPPAESWVYWITGKNGGSTAGGTYTLSVTYGGSTQTTGALNWNATTAQIESALNALSNVGGNAVAATQATKGNSEIVELNNMPGAVLTWDTTNVTNGDLYGPYAWKGQIGEYVPYDGAGKPLPFLALIQGSGNDIAVSPSTIQTNATTAAQYIAQNFRTCICIFTGVISQATHSGTGVVDSTDLAINAAIAAGAAYLNPVNGHVPFIDTYPNGNGSNALIFGSGSVASPTANKTDIYAGIATAGHPTGNGTRYLVDWMATKVKNLIGR